MKRILSLVVIEVALFACTPVKPWERSALMRRCMQSSLDPLESSMEVHLHRTREAMLGVEIGGGGSCGCN